MSFRARQPGDPCCEDDCLIPIEGWEQWAPSAWTVMGDTITTEDSDALLTADPDHPEDKSTHVVEVTVRGEDDGDILRVVVAYANANNYLYAEIEVGTVKGYLRLFQVTGGATFQLGDDVEIDPLAPATDHTVKVCYDGEVLMAIVNTDHSYARVVTATGEYVGLATGAITTLATFKNFRWWIHYDDGGYYGEPNNCPKCALIGECDVCIDNNTPLYFKAVVTGVTTVDPGCDCNERNGTYILELKPQPISDWCVYRVDLPGICNVNEEDVIVFWIISDPATGITRGYFRMSIWRGGFDAYETYNFDIELPSYPVDCFAIDDSGVCTYLFPQLCDPNSASVRVTAL